MAQTAREPAFCNLAIREPGALVVPDATADDRFRDSPLVTGEFGIRSYAGVPLRTPDGHVLGTLCAMDTRPRDFGPQDVEALADMAQLVTTMLELRREATTDALTGALSRRAFRDEAERMLGLARRHRHTFSCILIDIDHFKRVNDEQGHAVGDRVLCGCVDEIVSELRSSDAVGRIGGEEFGVLLPLTGAAAALDVAERLRRAVNRLRVPGRDGAVGVTASFGVATLDAATESVDALLAGADEALYGAKRAGRDRCLARQPMEADGVRAVAWRPVLKAGQVYGESGRMPVSCTVRVLSAEGAGLDVIDARDVPDTFALRIEGETARTCRVVSRTERRVEAAFA